jgi:hypothetical protein
MYARKTRDFFFAAYAIREIPQEYSPISITMAGLTFLWPL